MTDNVTPTDRTLAAKLLDDLHEVTGGEWGPGAMVTAMKALSSARDEGRLDAEKKRANEYANAARLIEWIENPGRKPANTAFTEGPERQVAYAVENLAEVYHRRSVLSLPEVKGLVEALKFIHDEKEHDDCYKGESPKYLFAHRYHQFREKAGAALAAFRELEGRMG